MKLTQELFKYAGIGERRLFLEWVSAAEGQRFAEIITSITEEVKAEGPFPAGEYRFKLEALIHTLKSEQARWVLGIERMLTEEGNVYGETLDPDEYREFVLKKLKDEYEKSLVYLALKECPQSVREVAEKIGMKVPHVAQLVVDLQTRGKVTLSGHEGTVTRFAALG